LGEQKPLGTGSVHLISQNGSWIAHPDGALFGKEWSEGRSDTDLAVKDELLAAVKKGESYVPMNGYSNTLGTTFCESSNRSALAGPTPKWPLSSTYRIRR
jgi:methyl-accepting chemotaxis protein